jgi:hypothetical protein
MQTRGGLQREEPLHQGPVARALRLLLFMGEEYGYKLLLALYRKLLALRRTVPPFRKLAVNKLEVPEVAARAHRARAKLLHI